MLIKNKYTWLKSSSAQAVFAGALMPLGFAPVHLPGCALIGIMLLFNLLHTQSIKKAWYCGILFGCAFMGIGISWIYVSVHTFGRVHPIFAILITATFIIYVSGFFGLMTLGYRLLARPGRWLFNCFLFSALWCLSEWLRANYLGGFPWLLLGFGQIDTPLTGLLPVIGVLGIGFIACLAASLFATGIYLKPKRNLFILYAVGLILMPGLLQSIKWTHLSKESISVAIIQANLSMHDKWDETVFWKLLHRYQTAINAQLGKSQLIVLPESAIPVPIDYLNDVIENLGLHAAHANSAILLGIPQTNSGHTGEYLNTMFATGTAHGTYAKKQLVPFGEFIPKPFQSIMHWLNLPTNSMVPGQLSQTPIQVQEHQIASLICYELAYPLHLREQLPQAEWVVSISDDGWFGHSLAVYQHQQIAQALSIMTGRYQIMANNDGLSSIISDKGQIIDSLPAFHAGILRSSLQPAHGRTPWVYTGDIPILSLSVSLFFLACWRAFRQMYQQRFKDFWRPRNQVATS